MRERLEARHRAQPRVAEFLTVIVSREIFQTHSHLQGVARTCLTIDEDEEDIIRIDIDDDMTEDDVLQRILSEIECK